MSACCHEGLYARLFARFYDPFMAAAERAVLFRKRRRLISPLRGLVLEVGSGTGVNFPLYHQDCHVIAAEPAPSMMTRAAEAKQALPPGGAQIELLPAGIGDNLLETRLPPAILDAAVCTLVLCTVPDLPAAIGFIWSRLKPGGKLVLLEHVQARSGAGRALQKALNPVWKRFALGCHLNRNPRAALLSAGFELEKEEEFAMTLPFYWAIWKKPD